MRALKGNEKTLGPKHASTLVMVNSLGSLYKCSLFSFIDSRPECVTHHHTASIVSYYGR